ncbi:hypothetical protein ABZW30_17490 [Kitasatospora sp. NPDC004669]|uniref:hypothetical protein n=1 Tax=Kitasatospora sp. NPDC004669 TaxID=3154555 RepID=UPI0033A83AC0
MRADHDILVEIPGVKPPTIRVLDASTLEAIWDSVRFLPMSRSQLQILERRFTGPCAERDVIRHLAGNPALVFPVGEYEVRISWANPTEEPA